MIMTEKEPPKIEFPCSNYVIKVIGDAHDEFKQLVIDIIRKHAPDIDETKITQRDSSNGKYHALQVPITATGIPQLQAINQDLKATGRVHMVL